MTIRVNVRAHAQYIAHDALDREPSGVHFRRDALDNDPVKRSHSLTNDSCRHSQTLPPPLNLESPTAPDVAEKGHCVAPEAYASASTPSIYRIAVPDPPTQNSLSLRVTFLYSPDADFALPGYGRQINRPVQLTLVFRPLRRDRLEAILLELGLNLCTRIPIPKGSD